MSDNLQQKAIQAVPSENGIEVLSEHQPVRSIKIIGHDGTARQYSIKEMSDDDLGIWMKAVGRRVVKNSKGKIVREDYRGFHSDLISLCLYDSGNRRVPKQIIQSWGANTKNRLFQICQEINGLTDKVVDEEEEKNSVEADMDGGNEK